jgi:hypothetical protein
VNPIRSKQPAHLSLLSPDSKRNKEGAGVLSIRIDSENLKPKDIRSGSSPVKVDVVLSPLSVVLDLVVWRRFYRFFAGGALEQTWYRDRKERGRRKKENKVGGKKGQFPVIFSFTVESLLLVAPVYQGGEGGYEESHGVTELRAAIDNLHMRLRTSDRYECPLRDGLFRARFTTFPCAPGDFESRTVPDSFMARVPWMQAGMRRPNPKP